MRVIRPIRGHTTGATPSAGTTPTIGFAKYILTIGAARVYLSMARKQQNTKGRDYDDSAHRNGCDTRSDYPGSVVHSRNGRPILTIGGIEHGDSDYAYDAGFADCGVPNEGNACADQVESTTLREGLIMTNTLDALDRAKVLNEVIARLGHARAAEASETHVTPEPNKWGCVGVDYTGGKYRARIRYCDALNGQDVRVTLIRTNDLAEADYAYRAAHVLLWGSASWAACDDIADALRAAAGRTDCED